ncbi:YecA family protein [Marinobacter sp. LN3S78]|uniref:YecA family protein n=1 Tax=Marinobacter sp. LN3S78 TaxID=3382300 RepID=UPI00387B5DF4
MMPLSPDKNRKETATSALKEMEEIAAEIRAIIRGMPAEELLGYIYAQRLMAVGDKDDQGIEGNHPDSLKKEINESQFLLEYVHAVLASDEAPGAVQFDEARCADLYELSRELREQSMMFAITSSVDTENQEFGPNTAELEVRAKSSWVVLRGNRYQVLENEFYRYVLAAHDDALTEAYGVGATEIAKGFQEIADATRTGQADAMLVMRKQHEAAMQYASAKGKSIEEVMEDWVAENGEEAEAARFAMEDMLRGGIANVSRHANLPAELLADLAYERGEEEDFFAKGDFSGTPYRTLPARKKPLLKLGSEYFAVDPCFIRDSGYRALLFNLLERKPDYKALFKERQKIMSEGAFPDILADQLAGATVYKEVYYKDPVTNQWVENDTLILIDDVLYLVEAKAGAAATIASPALDFKRHAQSIRDLILKAYKQCERFFNYLNSADQVPLFELANGAYQKIGQVSRSDYRVMVPIGLTVESFSPFSAYCKDLPEIAPLLQKHGFISMSIDDLLVLKRILPSAGAFAHYMEVRQAMAGMKRAHLFDEFDHLGAYISRNRFDQDIREQLREGEAGFVVWDGMSDVIDKYFEGDSWGTKPIPTQDFPHELAKLLEALNSTHKPGWLKADSLIRDYGEQGRKDLAMRLAEVGDSLGERPERYFAFTDLDQMLFIWMQNSSKAPDWQKIKDQAAASALYVQASAAVGIYVEVGNANCYEKAHFFEIDPPSKQTTDNAHIFAAAERIGQRMSRVTASPRNQLPQAQFRGKVGRNERCPCGSGLKYKKCHGR